MKKTRNWSEYNESLVNRGSAYVPVSRRRFGAMEPSKQGASSRAPLYLQRYGNRNVTARSRSLPPYLSKR